MLGGTHLADKGCVSSSCEFNRRIQITGGGDWQRALLVLVDFIAAVVEAEEEGGSAVVVIGCLAEESGLGNSPPAIATKKPTQPSLRASLRMTQYHGHSHPQAQRHTKAPLVH